MNLPRKIIFVRHGDYDNSGNLSSIGKMKMEGLSQNIESLVDKSSLLILSSSAPRAEQSAKVIEEQLGTVDSYSIEILWSDNRHPWNFEKAHDAIIQLSQGFDYVIVVTHLEYVDVLPYFFFRKYFPGDSFATIEIIKGQGIVVDFLQKDIKIVRYN